MKSVDLSVQKKSFHPKKKKHDVLKKSKSSYSTAFLRYYCT
jgi:hypothetical protein